MPHVSKRLLEKSKHQEIHRKLYKILSDLAQSGKLSIALNELLTKTEKLMLSKRLAIILMLQRGESTYAIEQILKVSPSTVARISLKFENGYYKELLEQTSSGTDFWSELEKIIPPRTGRNRFKHFLKF